MSSHDFTSKDNIVPNHIQVLYREGLATKADNPLVVVLDIALTHVGTNGAIRRVRLAYRGICFGPCYRDTQQPKVENTSIAILSVALIVSEQIALYEGSRHFLPT